MARAALAHLALGKVLFMPTGPTRYRTPAAASGEHRVAMLKLALEDERQGSPLFEIDARELGPGATGYTVDTLKELRLEYGPDSALWLLLGADQYAKLDSWHRPADVRRLARIGVFERAGWSAAGAQMIPFAPMAVSATDIRARVARGEDIAHLVPPAVATYIAREGLYRAREGLDR